MQVTFNVTQYSKCTLLLVLCSVYANALQHKVGNTDELLDELNGLFEDDMQACGLKLDAEGDVVFTEQMTHERAQQCSARGNAHAALEMLEEDESDVRWDDVQTYLMLAIVQRNNFIAGAQ